MKTEQITYDKFLQIANKMLENAEKLTVRNVHARLGGSFSKVSEFLKRFEQERADLSFAKQSNLSEMLTQAILGEIGKAVNDAKIALESQIKQLTAHLEEANEQLNKQEQRTEQLEEEQKGLKDKLMLTEQGAHELESTQKNLAEKLDETQKEKMLAVTYAAKSKLQLERADHDNKEIKEQIEQLQSRIDLLTTEKFEAEKRAAVAEAKFSR